MIACMCVWLFTSLDEQVTEKYIQLINGRLLTVVVTNAIKDVNSNSACWSS